MTDSDFVITFVIITVYEKKMINNNIFMKSKGK